MRFAIRKDGYAVSKKSVTFFATTYPLFSSGMAILTENYSHLAHQSASLLFNDRSVTNRPEQLAPDVRLRQLCYGCSIIVHRWIIGTTSNRSVPPSRYLRLQLPASRVPPHEYAH